MNPPCGLQFAVEDTFGVLGLQYHEAATLSCVNWGAAGIIGIGSPIYAFGVNDVRGDETEKNGCSPRVKWIPPPVRARKTESSQRFR